VLGLLIFQSDPPSKKLFEEFFEFADGRKQLEKIREDLCKCVIDDWHLEDTLRTLEHKNKLQKKREQNKAVLEQTRESIRSGRHLPNLARFIHEGAEERLSRLCYGGEEGNEGTERRRKESRRVIFR
jgi:hypothetical protein